jgi:hypothetical protein
MPYISVLWKQPVKYPLKTSISVAINYLCMLLHFLYISPKICFIRQNDMPLNKILYLLISFYCYLWWPQMNKKALKIDIFPQSFARDLLVLGVEQFSTSSFNMAMLPNVFTIHSLPIIFYTFLIFILLTSYFSALLLISYEVKITWRRAYRLLFSCQTSQKSYRKITLCNMY